MHVKRVALVTKYLGILVCALVTACGCILFSHFEARGGTKSFFAFCHELAQNLMLVCVGLLGAYYEYKGAFPTQTQSYFSLTFNRIGLGVFYFWIGAYAMGSNTFYIDEGSMVLGRITGVLAWMCAVSNVFYSCGFAEQNLADQQRFTLDKPLPNRAAPQAVDLEANPNIPQHGNAFSQLPPSQLPKAAAPHAAPHAAQVELRPAELPANTVGAPAGEDNPFGNEVQGQAYTNPLGDKPFGM